MFSLLLVAFLACRTMGVSPPVWPNAWNATTAKIRPFSVSTRVHWSKIWYDWGNRVQRQDFYDQYFGYEPTGWTNATCSILFVGDNIYFYFAGDDSCAIDHSGIPPVNPKWLLDSEYQGEAMIRGVPTYQFYLPPPSNVTYFARQADMLPVRSTNQFNDPGCTDYMDVLVGPQAPSLFQLPNACANAGPPKRPCPPWDP